ncbi:ABC transporter ATP-binding protein [Segeticoccus rhizosphaerae]|jgi:ATP-binding cassette subfamily B protein|uniref:ABC transporter ATP-binding protein n=1 Tax=Segeticoccus rhizosphaerae TaxID=1104777 RepID=UPI00192E4A59|nr:MULTISPECIES: ABC transporter ATP-binding protein [Intrasporangiaceae]HEX5427483.1 ABC transporter ATP-binding protein [Pedococcus sp.]
MSSSRRLVLHARLLWRASPVYVVLCLLLTLLSAAATVSLLVVSGHLVGSFAEAYRQGPGSQAASETWRLMVLVGVLFVLAPVCQVGMEACANALSARYLVLVFDLLAETALAPHGIAHLEDPEKTSQLEGLVTASRDWSFMQGVLSTWQLLLVRLTGLGALGVLLTWSWWAPLLLVGAWLLLSRTFRRWMDSATDNLLDVTGNDRRKAAYLRSLLMDRSFAKEVRLFGLSDFLAARYRRTWLAAMQLVWSNRNRTLGPVGWATLVMLLVNAGAFALLGREAWTGALSVAGLVTMAQAIPQLENFGPVGDMQMYVARNTAVVAQLAQLRGELGMARSRPGPDLPGAPGEVPTADEVTQVAPAEIVLDDVSFGYPTREDQVFSGLDLRVPAGQSLGVVGVNGAGKSTLIKLLCGLYAPDSGTVRIDGRNPMADDATRRRVAVIFQDFVRYQLSLRDNVLLGADDGPESSRALSRALDEASGTPLLKRLPQGWGTVLSAEYDHGQDLSGGQWQRVALARAFSALDRGAGVLVLDEPTAALDVRAEKELFDRFLEVTHGMTSILVSHRLSSVRHADRIVVVDEGRVVEDGSHEELMRAEGPYAQMFRLQAARFTECGDHHGGSPHDSDHATAHEEDDLSA